MPNANWSNPTLTSTYVNFVTEVKSRDEDLALQFDGTTSTNLPTNAIRWDSAANRWKKWNGSSWVELTATYALTGLTTTGQVLVGTSSAAPSLTADGIGLGTSTGRKIDLYNSTTTHMGLGVDVGGGPYELSIYGPAGTASQGTIRFGFISEGNPGTWTERARIDSSGRVGIGTSSPTGTNGAGYNSLLTVNGNSNTAIDIKDTNGNWFIGTTAGSLVAYSQTAGAERLRIDSSGRVGIGTSSPSVPLQVLNAGTGNDTNNGAITLCRTATVGSTLYHMYASGVSDEAFAFSVHGGTAFSNTLYTKYLATAGGIHVWYGGTTATERMRIDSSGRVGIGTSAPGSKLEIYNTGTLGTIYQPAVYITNNSGGGTAANPTGLGAINWRVDSLYDVANIEAVREVPTSGTLSSLVFRTNGTNASTGAGTERMRIDSSGRVGIGTSSPAQTLDVAGNVDLRSNNSFAFDAGNKASLNLGYYTNYNSAPGSIFTFGIQNTSAVNSGAVFRYSLGLAGDAAGHSCVLSSVGSTGTVTERLRIDSSGRLGVGTTTPSPYEHGGTINVIELKNANTSTNAQAQFIGSSGFTGSGQSAVAGLTGALPDISATNKMIGWLGISTESGHTSASPASSISFGTRSGTGVPVERMRIGSTGAISTVIPGGSTLYPAFNARAWVKFTGTGTVAIGGSGNVSSITDVNVGVYNVNFTTAMPDTEYCTIVTGQQAMARGGGNDASGLYVVNIGTAPVTYTTSSVGVSFQDSGGTGEDTNVACVAVFR